MSGPDPRGPGMAVRPRANHQWAGHRVDPTQPRGTRRDPDQWAAGYRAGRAAVPPATGGGGGGNRSGCALLTLLTLLATCLIGALL